MEDAERILAKRLERVIRPEAVPAWMETPVEALDGETPAELIRRGEQRKVEKLVSELEDPGAI
jgi:Protein of unknown function (DUF2384)